MLASNSAVTFCESGIQYAAASRFSSQAYRIARSSRAMTPKLEKHLGASASSDRHGPAPRSASCRTLGRARAIAC